MVPVLVRDSRLLPHQRVRSARHEYRAVVRLETCGGHSTRRMRRTPRRTGPRQTTIDAATRGSVAGSGGFRNIASYTSSVATSVPAKRPVVIPRAVTIPSSIPQNTSRDACDDLVVVVEHWPVPLSESTIPINRSSPIVPDVWELGDRKSDGTTTSTERKERPRLDRWVRTSGTALDYAPRIVPKRNYCAATRGRDGTTGGSSRAPRPALGTDVRSGSAVCPHSSQERVRVSVVDALGDANEPLLHTHPPPACRTFTTQLASFPPTVHVICAVIRLPCDGPGLHLSRNGSD